MSMTLDSIEQLLQKAEVTAVKEYGPNTFIVEYKADGHDLEFTRFGKEGNFYSISVKKDNEYKENLTLALPGYDRGQTQTHGHLGLKKMFDLYARPFFEDAS